MAIPPSTQSQQDRLVTLVLGSFGMAYGKTIDLAFGELGKGHMRDGEDCWLDQYGLPLQVPDSVEAIIALLDEALDWLNEYDGKYAYFDIGSSLDPWFTDLSHRLEIRRVSFSAVIWLIARNFCLTSTTRHHPLPVVCETPAIYFTCAERFVILDYHGLPFSRRLTKI